MRAAIPVRHRMLGLLLALCLGGGLAACSDDEPAPPQTFAPLSYGYLRPLRLTVGAIRIDDSVPTAGTGRDLGALSPASPVEALRSMARDRLVASGSSGQGVFTVQQASITRDGDMLNGLLRVRLDVFTSDGRQAAYAEAGVARSATAPDGDNEPTVRAALYALTRQMMDDMNVEFEFQLRRSLGDWLQSGDGPAPLPPAVQQQALPPPSGLAPASLSPAAGGSSQTPPAELPPGTRFRLVPSPLPSPGS